MSAHTIVAVLQEAPDSPATTAQDGDTLAALVQHLAEWATNPAAVPSSRYGTGWRYRRQLLSLTTHPTVLSRQGGPFHLFQYPVSATGTARRNGLTRAPAACCAQARTAATARSPPPSELRTATVAIRPKWRSL
ncbi:hypothetical protein [Streptomyces sp. NBC_01455]|uniref:hypothetical protein n=1 Tax=Streptomyces sp. NBC_01455 TaxID=2903874 RepID=UPI002E3488E0|nr:hypothetical protein [Streptomyces sp. NBC_01455]